MTPSRGLALQIGLQLLGPRHVQDHPARIRLLAEVAVASPLWPTAQCRPGSASVKAGLSGLRMERDGTPTGGQDRAGARAVGTYSAGPPKERNTR